MDVRKAKKPLKLVIEEILLRPNQYYNLKELTKEIEKHEDGRFHRSDYHFIKGYVYGLVQSGKIAQLHAHYRSVYFGSKATIAKLAKIWGLEPDGRKTCK